MGSHILDVARFLFGEVENLYCQTKSVHKDIKGEDVASVMMNMGGTTVLCELSYASHIKQDRFPEVYIRIEGERGAIELGPDYWLHVTTEDETSGRRYPPPHYSWADPSYDLIHASIVECNRDILKALQGERNAETTGDDNLKTVKLVFAAYDSAAKNSIIDIKM
jgi:predicted dehydrogenase